MQHTRRLCSLAAPGLAVLVPARSSVAHAEEPRYYGSYSKDRFGGGIGRRVGLDESGSCRIPGTCLTRVALVEETHESLARWATKENFNAAQQVHLSAYFTRTTNPFQEEVLEKIREHYVASRTRGYKARQPVTAAMFRCDDDAALEAQLRRSTVRMIPSIAYGKMDEKNEPCIVDFANKRLGGGWLGYGQVQEEIMFTERFDIGALCAKALTEMPEDPVQKPVACKFSMHANEAWVIKGSPRFAHIPWYGRVKEGFVNRLQLLDPSDDLETSPTVICIDAIKASFERYERGHLMLMLRKAYCGFAAAAHDPKIGGQKVVATGSWGCGAFYNNECVMFVVQTLAANAAGVTLTHHVLGDGRRLAPAFAFLENAMLKKLSVVEALDELAELCASDDAWRSKFDPSKETFWTTTKHKAKL